MCKLPTIEIESFQQLLQRIEGTCLYVVWDVRCDIGPEWIGGGRKIRLLIDGRPIADSAFCDRLKSAIVSAAAIPLETTNTVISGEGEISLVGARLILEFEWSEAKPYDYPCNQGGGVVEIVIPNEKSENT